MKFSKLCSICGTPFRATFPSKQTCWNARCELAAHVAAKERAKHSYVPHPMTPEKKQAQLDALARGRRKRGAWHGQHEGEIAISALSEQTLRDVEARAVADEAARRGR